MEKTCSAGIGTVSIIPDVSAQGGVIQADVVGIARWRREFSRYFAISIVALVVDTMLLVALASVTHYIVAASVGFITGAIVSYWLATRWAFQKRRMVERSGVEFGIYFVLGLIGLGINNLVIFLVFGELGVALVFAKAIAAMATFAFNFVARKLVLF